MRDGPRLWCTARRREQGKAGALRQRASHERTSGQTLKWWCIATVLLSAPLSSVPLDEAQGGAHPPEWSLGWRCRCPSRAPAYHIPPRCCIFPLAPSSRAPCAAAPSLLASLRPWTTTTDGFATRNVGCARSNAGCARSNAGCAKKLAGMPSGA